MIQIMPDGVDSKFRLVLLVARRAEQLMRGARPKVESDRPLKPTRLAFAEFEHDQIQWGYGAEGGVLETSAEAEAEAEEQSEELDSAVEETEEEEAAR
jgi:DNA-directed RNA polymerase omega subunit